MVYTELGKIFKQKIEAISGLSPRQQIQLLGEIASEKDCSVPDVLERVLGSKGCFDLFSKSNKTSADRIRLLKEIRKLESFDSTSSIRSLCQFFGAFDEAMLVDEDLIVAAIRDESKISWVADEIPRKTQFFPWARLWARSLDFVISTFLIGVLFGLILPEGSLASPADEMKLSLLGIALNVLIVEPYLISVFGTTPGKRLYGICVLNSDGKPLSFRDSVNRSLLVFVRGEWFCIPVLIAIGRLRAYSRYKQFGVTFWDELLGINYKHPTCSRARILFTNVLIFSVLFGLFALDRFTA